MTPARRDGEYWFDEDAAARAVEFFRLLKHIKGPWAGRPFELAPWQREKIIEPLFGWKRAHTCASPTKHNSLTCEYGRRRYRELDLLVPRKNGKTSLCAGLLLIGLCADDEQGAECYCMAGDLDQAADLIFDVAATMVDKSPVLKERLRVFRSANRIVDPITGSFLQAIPGDWEGAMGFSPHVAVMDEHEVQANTKLENAITSGMGARQQPIFIRASTVGRNINSPTGRLYLRIKDVLGGVRAARPDELVVLFEAPVDADWRKVKTWIVANPGYGVSLQPAFVAGQIRKAIDEPAERDEILQYGINRWPVLTGTWMPVDKWDTCGALIDEAALAGRRCIVGVGISSATDLAAVAILFPPETAADPYVLLMVHYLPEDTMRDRKGSQDAPPYADWVEKGALKLTAGNVIDYATIEADVLERFGSKYEIQEIACNPRGAMQFMQNLQGEDQNVVELVPSYKTMSPAFTELERLVGERKLEHNGDVVLRYEWAHCVMRKGPNSEIRPDRERSKVNIEGIIALGSAMNRAITSTETGPAWGAA